MGKGKRCIQFINIFLLKAVDLLNMGIHDLLKALIKKTVQAEVVDSRKTAPYFMIPAHTRIKLINAVGNCPFNRAVITRIKMQVFYFF